MSELLVFLDVRLRSRNAAEDTKTVVIEPPPTAFAIAYAISHLSANFMFYSLHDGFTAILRKELDYRDL